MHENGAEILSRLGIRFERVDSGGRVHPADPEFWSLVGTPMPDRPILVCDAFEEAIGAEEAIAAALSGGHEFRLSGFERGGRFLDLFIFPADGRRGGSAGQAGESAPEASAGFIVVEDVSEAMATRQSLVQSRNEISILGKRLEHNRDELREAHDRLALLVREVRTRNHDLDLQVKLRTRELHVSRLSALTTLARIAEFRDTDTGDHIYRLGRSSVLIGKRLGLAPIECEELFYACLLHDVGKIGIPDSVLLKPAKLDADEWQVMRGHTRIGAEILSRGDHTFFDAAREVALHHHERWDGSGYPDGLSGEAIPLSCRICAVADVFDALTSERPYKNAWTVADAMDAMRADSGAAFDPVVFAAFESEMADIVALRVESREPEYLLPDFD